MPRIQCNGVVLPVDQVGTSRRMLGRHAQAFELLRFDYRGMGASAPIGETCALVQLSAIGVTAVAAVAGLSARQHGWQLHNLDALSSLAGHAVRVHGFGGLRRPQTGQGCVCLAWPSPH